MSTRKPVIEAETDTRKAATPESNADPGRGTCLDCAAYAVHKHHPGFVFRLERCSQGISRHAAWCRDLPVISRHFVN